MHEQVSYISKDDDEVETNKVTDNGVSVLQAASDALNEAARHSESVLVHLVTEVISHLEHAGAVHDPSSLQERGVGKS
jgi:hypothetical protein